jgi:hypothetical protein
LPLSARKFETQLLEKRQLLGGVQLAADQHLATGIN